MRINATTCLTLGIGAAFGVAFTLSCSDDSPHGADAATCDCPAAEPPIPGRLITVTGDRPVAAGTDFTVAATCPTGTQTLSGMCTSTDPGGPTPGLVLMENGFVVTAPALPVGWSCIFHNNSAASIMVRATAICLKPAS